MSHLITLWFSEAEMTSLSREADGAGATVEDFARHLLCSQRFSQDVATVELGQLRSDLSELRAASRRLEQKLELVYQLAYFFGKKLATNPSEFHSFVVALKERAQQEI
ncbi:MAG: hypothetical protein L0Z53_03995 [Acidobacteriales bacterium]|nr:hypothetical protein [Terriglobales bacterium]MCI0422641.1 hypothetical protein [Acidobacteriota bacterium]